MTPHVRSVHKDEYEIGKRITGGMTVSHWTKTTLADIRAVQRAEAIDAFDASVEPELALSPTLAAQITELVRGLSFDEATRVFTTVLVLKTEDEVDSLRERLTSLRERLGG